MADAKALSEVEQFLISLLASHCLITVWTMCTVVCYS